MKTLVLSGGSTKIPLHVGAYKALHEKGMMFNTIWGNSCGSIMAAAISVGMQFEKIEKLALEIDFGELTKNQSTGKANLGKNSTNTRL